MDELKACPFCGKSNLRVIGEYIERAQGYGFRSYSVCHEASIYETCTGSASGATEAKAVEAWNRRVALQETSHG